MKAETKFGEYEVSSLIDYITLSAYFMGQATVVNGKNVHTVTPKGEHVFYDIKSDEPRSISDEMEFIQLIKRVIIREWNCSSGNQPYLSAMKDE